MNCQRVEELVLTDYIDGRMGDQFKGLIDQHLGECPACQELLDAVKRDVVGPLSNTPRLVAGEALWSQIREAVAQEERLRIEKAITPGFWEKLRSTVFIPRPAFAIVTIVSMFFIFSSTPHLFLNSPLPKVNGGDQLAYLSPLIEETGDVTDNNGNEPQTPIEQYFL